MTFQPGDVVALKSGGQFMTVSAATDNGIECIWIGEEGELFRETLPVAVLTAASDGDDDDEEAEAVEGDEEADEEKEEDVRKIA